MKAIRPLIPLFLFLILIVSGASAAVPGIDTTGSAKADAHALSAPQKASQTIEGLSQYLTAPFKTDYLKARAIYTWLIHNVGYDANRAFSGRAHAIVPATEANTRNNPQNAANVLASRLAVCQGYSNLFQQLCKASAIEALTVSGYDKGWFYQNSHEIALTHAWNVIRLENRWYPVDATWGAGYADAHRKFVPQPSYAFFLASPDEFVQKHLPSDPAYQLMPSPVPMSVFQKSDPEIQAFTSSQKAKAVNWDDTLTAEAALEPTLREYRSMKRAVAFIPQNHWARLKLAEFHASRAMEAFGQYQEALEQTKAGQGRPSPQALATLDQAEAELLQSQTWLRSIPNSEKDLSGFASSNSRLIDKNLQSIRQQKKYWQEHL